MWTWITDNMRHLRISMIWCQYLLPSDWLPLAAQRHYGCNGTSDVRWHQYVVRMDIRKTYPVKPRTPSLRWTRPRLVAGSQTSKESIMNWYRRALRALSSAMEIRKPYGHESFRNSRLQRMILGVTFSIVPFSLTTSREAQSFYFISQSSRLSQREVSTSQNFAQQEMKD